MYSRITEKVPVKEINGFFNAHGFAGFDPAQTSASEVGMYLQQVVDAHGGAAYDELARLIEKYDPPTKLAELPAGHGDGTNSKHNCEGGGCSCGGKKMNADGGPAPTTGFKGFVHKHGEILILAASAITIAFILKKSK